MRAWYGVAVSVVQVFDEDKAVFNRMDAWVEAGDWFVWQVCCCLALQRKTEAL